MYDKTTWVAEEGVNLNRFFKENESSEYVDLSRSPSSVTQAGTIFSTTLMNNIEDGIENLYLEGVDPWVNSADVTYPAGAITKYQGALWLALSANSETEPTTNQDVWKLLSTYTIQQNLSDGDTITVGWQHIKGVIDVSLGNATLGGSIPVPKFLGQKGHFVAEGTGIAEIPSGNGLYVNSVFITENTGGLHIEAVDDGAGGLVWSAFNGVTADYDDTTLTSYGKIIEEITTSFSSTTSVSNALGSTSGTMYQGQVTLSMATPATSVRATLQDSGSDVRAHILNVTDYTDIFLRVWTIVSTSSVTCKLKFEGDY